MPALEQLPADQRAVVELVLARGRDYDEIARMLSIDRAGVRERALSALDTLGADTEVPAPRRALITDYLLGQLPDRVAADVAARLEREPAEAAWARAVAGSLAPIAAHPLPPVGDSAAEARPNGATAALEADRTPAAREPDTTPEPAVSPGGDVEDTAAPTAEVTGASPAHPRPSSRRGGLLMLGLGALALAAIVVLVIAALSGGGSSSASHSSTTNAASGSTPANTTAPMKLTATTPGSKAQGIAEAFTQGGTQYLAIVAINLPPNSTKTGSRDFYAVWLSNGSGGDQLLGFAPPVTSNGQLRAATKLTPPEKTFSKLLVTRETQAHPAKPGALVLSGPFSVK